MSTAPALSTSTSLSPRAARAATLFDLINQDPAAAARIDELVDTARRALGSAGAQLSMMTDRVISGAVSAPSMPGLHRGMEHEFSDTACVTALRTGGPVQVEDATADSRVSSIPAVTDGLLGAYMGMPVWVGGSLVGVLCVFGGEPRSWSEQDRERLDELAADVSHELVDLESDAARAER